MGDDYPAVWVHRHHHGRILFAVLGMLLIGVVALLLLEAGAFAFEKIGFTPLEFAVILFLTFLGSAVDIPLYSVKSIVPMVEVQEVRAFWVTYRVPHRVLRQVSTIVAVNLGGALIPSGVSIYLLATHSESILLDAGVGVVVTSILVHLIARRVPGVGIVTPALLPPLFAATVALVLVPGSPAIVAYVSGTFGTLIGADLTNLRHADNSGARMESIGGAGTFDGVFLTGIVAVILAALI
ncbi:MAG: DUF1614 domain-containing protein [Thaumarchaeota archaeon]|nr:DUF1614 domain-containing protein [Nitrososphaerota archaeon]